MDNQNQNVSKLSKEAKDIIQAIFDYNVPCCFGMSPDAIEVKTDLAVHYLLWGDNGVHYHALGNTEHYLNHRNDKDWAIVFNGSKIGNAEKGKEIINSGDEIIIKETAKT